MCNSFLNENNMDSLGFFTDILRQGLFYFLGLTIGFLGFSIPCSSQVYELPRYISSGSKFEERTLNYKLSQNLSGIELNVVISDGLVITGGDMILGGKDEFFGMQTYAVGTSDDFLWPDGIIPYKEPDINHPCRKEILSAINEFNQKTNICFVKHTNQKKFISFGQKDCNALVGYHENLGYTTVNVSPSCGCKAVHELGHVAGLFHEHQSPKRDENITILEQNIPKEVLTKNFKKAGYQIPTTSYDLASVMHYAPKIILNNQEVEIFKCKSGPCASYVGYTKNLSKNDIAGINYLYPFKRNCDEKKFPTLFLFDLSGSMAESGASGKPKIEEARQAAKSTLQTIRSNNQQGVSQEVGIQTFAGMCVSDPTAPIDPGFTSDLNSVAANIDLIGVPGGGTPLAEAVEASKSKLLGYMASYSLSSARLIILSDGQATCQPVRPADVYAFGQAGQVSVTLSSQSQASPSNPLVRYFTVGFNIAPGSPAERDLQYLAQISGGKYLNAQNQFELTRAFQKFNRLYVPKPEPALPDVPADALAAFNRGLSGIYNEQFLDALTACRDFTRLQQEDCNGVYNLALMLEANERYKSAVESYERYLLLCPDAGDQAFVQKLIGDLKLDYTAFLEFNRKVVESDMAYLKLHFQKIQNGESIALAYEFIAFINEKRSYYQLLPELLEIDDRNFRANAREVFLGLENCAKMIKRNPRTWDRDASTTLSPTYLFMERLLKSFKP